MPTDNTPKNAGEHETMPDVQSSADSRRVAIDRVGVKEVVYPIRLHTKAGGEQTTVAKINMYVALPHHQKGTHMSRFLEVLNEHSCQPLTPDDIPDMTEAIRTRLNAHEAHFEATFTYFIEKKAPVTGQAGLMNYEVAFECTASADLDRPDMIMRVAAPATSLCPCSKEISDYGAHNQRSSITVSVSPAADADPVWIEDLVELAEGAASSPVYGVLKRPDEKFVTEAAYDNPKFVEDLVRDIATPLDADERVAQYLIDVENVESIHNHSAFAREARDKR